jgi:hypothetical protein
MNFATRHKQRGKETKNLNIDKKNNDKTTEYERRRQNNEIIEWDEKRDERRKDKWHE